MCSRAFNSIYNMCQINDLNVKIVFREKKFQHEKIRYSLENVLYINEIWIEVSHVFQSYITFCLSSIFCWNSFAVWLLLNHESGSISWVVDAWVVDSDHDLWYVSFFENVLFLSSFFGYRDWDISVCRTKSGYNYWRTTPSVCNRNLKQKFKWYFSFAITVQNDTLVFKAKYHKVSEVSITKTEVKIEMFHSLINSRFTCSIHKE